MLNLLLDLKPESTMDVIYSAVADAYNAHSERHFDKNDISLYYQHRKNSISVGKIEDMDTFRAQLKNLNKKDAKTLGFDSERVKNIINLAAQGPQEEGSEPDSWPRDGHKRLVPPAMQAPMTQAAKHDHQKSLEVNAAVLEVYNNPLSPLFHGINLDHMVFIKSFLLSAKGAQLLDKIKSRQFPAGIDAYLDTTMFLGGWHDHQLMLATKNHIPARDSCQPDPKHLGKIPLATYPVEPAKASSAEVLTNGMLAMGKGLGDSIILASGRSAAAPQQVYVREYASLDAFLENSALSGHERTTLRTACSDDLLVLAECIEESLRGTGKFHDEFAAYVAEFNAMSCMKLLARAKQSPTPPP